MDVGLRKHSPAFCNSTSNHPRLQKKMPECRLTWLPHRSPARRPVHEFCQRFFRKAAWRYIHAQTSGVPCRYFPWRSPTLGGRHRNIGKERQVMDFQPALFRAHGVSGKEKGQTSEPSTAYRWHSQWHQHPTIFSNNFSRLSEERLRPEDGAGYMPTTGHCPHEWKKK